MRLFLTKLQNLFLLFIIILFSVSCAILEDEVDNNSLKLSQADIKKNICPPTKIPFKTAKYIANKKYILSIKKIEMVCKSEKFNQSNLFDIIIEYKAKIKLNSNRKIKENNLLLPSIYIAIVDMEKETVLAKLQSNIEANNKEENFIVNKKKIRFKYESYENLSIYFGLQ